MSTLTVKRKIGERVMVGDDVVIEITGYDRGQVHMAVSAPRDVAVDREEVRKEKVRRAQLARDKSVPASGKSHRRA